MRPLYLVACVAGKLDRPAPARELYTSPWFQKARAYVEARGADWRILSALHGLVHPGQVLAPYEHTMADNLSRLEWASRVIAQLEHEAPLRPLVMLAGKAYRHPLRWLSATRTVTVPMEGLGIGQQLAWLGAHREAAA